jgi:hypothetical protein
MLNELFSWLYLSEPSTPFPHEVYPLGDLQQAQRSAQQQHRILRSRLHAESYTASSLPSIMTDLQKQVADHAAWSVFLDELASQWGAQTEKTAIDVALDYILAKPLSAASVATDEANIAMIFSDFLAINAEAALAYYERNTHRLARFPQVGLLLATHRTREHGLSLSRALEAQASLLALAPLCRQWVVDTERFAAMILLFLQRGIAVQTLLETGLLQHFIAYHIAWLNTDEDQVRLLYDILRQFPEAAALVEEASKVQCEVRGFYFEKQDDEAIPDDARSYAITGQQCFPTDLHRVESRDSEFLFSPAAENFNALYQLFGLEFIITAFECYLRAPNEVLHACLSKAFNEDVLQARQLPFVINTLAVRNVPHALANLVALLNDKTFEDLLLQHDGSILHLLSYKPSLSAMIPQDDLLHYLHEVSAASESPFVFMMQLLSLLKVFCKAKKEHARTVYELLLDNLCQSPYLVDDDVIKQLRQFSQKKPLLLTRYQALQDEFDVCFAEQAQTKPLTPACYHILEDVWRSVIERKNVLNEIMPMVMKCPEDKYALQALFAKACFLASPADFDLDEFIATLGIEVQWQDEAVSYYERLLLEILTTIDSDDLRQKIIAKFEAMESKRGHGLVMMYGNETLFDRAAGLGNIGLLQWLTAKQGISSAQLHRCLTIAAAEGQWEVLQYTRWHKTSPHPSKNILKDVLLLAAEAGELTTARFLCERGLGKLDESNLNSMLCRVISRGHIDMAEYICAFSDHYGSLQAAFKYAIEFDQLAVLERLAGRFFDERLFSVLEHALLKKTAMGSFDFVRGLCSLSPYPMKKAKIEEAFTKAVKAGQFAIAVFFTQLAVNAPGEVALDAGFVEAVSNGQLGFVRELFKPGTLSPSQAAINKALLVATRLKHVDILTYLCDGTVPPESGILRKGLSLAIKMHHPAMIEFFAGRVPLPFVRDCLKIAVKSDRLEVVKAICKKVSLDGKSLSFLRALAQQKHNEGIVKFLQRPARLVVPLPEVELIKSGYSSPQCTSKPQLVPMRRSLSCGAALNAHGFFGGGGRGGAGAGTGHFYDLPHVVKIGAA